MKIDDNGTVREMTADEIKAFEEMLKKDDLISSKLGEVNDKIKIKTTRRSTKRNIK